MFALEVHAEGDVRTSHDEITKVYVTQWQSTVYTQWRQTSCDWFCILWRQIELAVSGYVYVLPPGRPGSPARRPAQLSGTSAGRAVRHVGRPGYPAGRLAESGQRDMHGRRWKKKTGSQSETASQSETVSVQREHFKFRRFHVYRLTRWRTDRVGTATALRVLE